MARIAPLTAAAAQSLSGWVCRSQADHGDIELIVRGQEGFSPVITTTPAALARGKILPMFWAGKGCKDMGLIAGKATHEAEVARVMTHCERRRKNAEVGKKKKKRRKGKDVESAGDEWEPIPRQSMKCKEKENTAYSVVLAAPKTISMLLASEDAEVREAAIEAVETAAKAALSFAEENLTVRTGRNGKKSKKISGLTAACAVHRTSSAGDPHIHIHFLISSLARPEGEEKYRRLDGRVFMGAVGRVMEGVFQAELRVEIGRRFGLREEDWQPALVGPNIAWEIESLRAGVENLSTAKKHVTEIAEQIGASTADFEQHRLAWWRHRREKNVLVEKVTHAIDVRLKLGGQAAEKIREEWRERAGKEACEAIQNIKVKKEGNEQEPSLGQAVIQLWQDFRRGIDQEDFREFTFRRHEYLTAKLGRYSPGDMWANIVSMFEGMPAEVARQIAADALELLFNEGELIAREPEKIVRVLRQGTTETADLHLALGSVGMMPRQVLSREENIRLLARLLAADGMGEPQMTDEDFAGLDAQQKTALQVMDSGRRLVCVQGVAGAGKSFLLTRLVQCGGDILVVARNAKMAAELGDRLGVPSETVAKFVRRKKGFDGLLILDESSLVDQIDMLAILRCVWDGGGRAVFLGDSRQIAAIDRIGTWAAVQEEARQHGAWAELTETWRCRKWREEHEQWRNGTLDVEALGDRIIAGGTRDDAMRKMVEEVVRRRQAGEEVLILSFSNEEAAEIAETIQGAMGIVPDSRTLLRHEQQVGEGDIIRVRRNDRELGLRNGDVLRVMEIQDEGTVVAEDAVGRRHRLGRPWTAEWAELAYSLTADSAQGLTVDRAVIWLGQGGGWTDWHLYSAVTRGREAPIIAGEGDVRGQIRRILTTPQPVLTARSEAQQLVSSGPDAPQHGGPPPTRRSGWTR